MFENHPLIFATCYRIGDPNNDPLYVEYRGKHTWAIVYKRYGNDYCINKDGKLEYEPLPSNRTEDFVRRTRWNDLTHACMFALQYLEDQKNESL